MENERDGERERSRVIHESRELLHSGIVQRQELPAAYWMQESEGVNATGMPLVYLSAVSVAYCNPVPRFRVASVVLSNIIKAAQTVCLLTERRCPREETDSQSLSAQRLLSLGISYI